MNLKQQLTTKPLLDQDVLERLKSEVGEATLDRLLNLFLKDTKSATQELHRLYEIGNHRAIQSLADTLRSTCETCGATRSAYAATKLAEACGDGAESTQINAWLVCLADTLNESISALNKKAV